MRILIWGLVLAIFGSALALWLQSADGLVLVLAPPWRIELSLALATLLLAAAILLSFLLSGLLRRVAAFPSRAAAYRRRRAEMGAQRALREAVKALFEGRFARAERAARDAGSVRENAGVAALLGARAAHRLDQAERRDEWLARLDRDRDMATARWVAGAEMLAENHEAERALAALEHLPGGGARHLHAARIGLRAHLQAGRWVEALRGVRLLRKRNALHPALADGYALRAELALIEEAGDDAQALQAAWQQLPSAERRRPEIALAAARRWQALGLDNAAARALEEAIAACWDERLVEAYGEGEGAPARSRIERAERWNEQRPDDPAVLRCLGRLCLRAQLWGKARGYLEASARARFDPRTSLALAELAEALGETDAAAPHYRDAARALAGRAPEGRGLSPSELP